MTTHDLTQTAAPRAGRGRALCAAALALACAARAQSPQRDAPSASEIGHATQAWFALQASNREAAPAQPMIGEAASLAYARYIESFRTKIPAFYGSAAGMSGMSGGGGGGGGAGYSLAPAPGSQ
ncbi:lipoprotein [Burkholderia pseudomallei]|nr:lipoprotein [Burkholderia pseudomallei]